MEGGLTDEMCGLAASVVEEAELHLVGEEADERADDAVDELPDEDGRPDDARPELHDEGEVDEEVVEPHGRAHVVEHVPLSERHLRPDGR